MYGLLNIYIYNAHLTHVDLNLSGIDQNSPALYCPAQYTNYTGKHTAGVNKVGLAGLAGATKASIFHAQLWNEICSVMQDSDLVSNDHEVGLELK